MINSQLTDSNVEYLDPIHECKLYQRDDIDHHFPSNTSLNVLHINIRSVAKNFDELKVFLSPQGVPISIIVISETWIDDGVGWHDSEMNNYDCFHSARHGRRGGGVTLLIE